MNFLLVLIAAPKGLDSGLRLDALEEKLKSLETQFIRIDGKTPQQQRPSLVEKFQTQDVQVAAWCGYFVCVCVCADFANTHPCKTNVEDENAPLEKEEHLQTTNFGFHVSFRGMYVSLLTVDSSCGKVVFSRGFVEHNSLRSRREGNQTLKILQTYALVNVLTPDLHET